MKFVKMSAVAVAALALTTTVYAEDAKPKRELKNNMMEVYNTLPANAESLAEAFTNGVFYGRLRMNTFKWDWRNEVDGKTKDNVSHGLGGSLIYKTAPLYGVSATAGLYFSAMPFGMFREEVVADLGKVKAGKDTFSRYDVATDSDYYMAVLAQAYLQYDVSKTTVKAGRQIIESVLTKSNDTKMIPNTFEALVVEMNEIPKTKLRGAYITAQKLRDHTTFHDVITVGTEDYLDPYNSWDGNDDSAKHGGLTYKNFEAAGADPEHVLIVVDASTKIIPNLQVDVTYTAVPDVVSSVIGELNYKIPLGEKLSLTPGVRYMHQMDDGGGEVGGSSLTGKNVKWVGSTATYTANGYTQTDSLDSSLYMARLVLTDGIFKVQAGYSAVADEADIVAPWRGFPTGGYTRAMAQYNWYANTKTTAVEGSYNFSKAGLVKGFSATARYAMQDFDENKQVAGVQADSDILHIDLRQQITPNFDAKVRLGFVSADERLSSGIDQDSYNEYRFELNYLF